MFSFSPIKMIKSNEILRVLCYGLPVGVKYSKNVRSFCFSISYHSCAAYELLRDTFNKNLPHIDTIKSWYAVSDCKAEEGVQDEHIKKLKAIADDFHQGTGSQLTCALVFDEMYIRKQVFWTQDKFDFIGYVSSSYEPNQNLENSTNRKRIVRQAIVFMLSGINKSMQFPVAYYFIHKLDKYGRSKILKEIIEAVTKCGVKIANLTFDGFCSNVSACEMLGADLKIGSDEFQPYILNDFNGEKIFIVLDPCHMLKLIRNTLAKKKIIYDDNGDKIDFCYFESLVDYSQNNQFNTHKMTRKHLQWERNCMCVQTATQTLSNSVANSMEFLMKQNHPNFKDSAPTIRSVFQIKKKILQYPTIATDKISLNILFLSISDSYVLSINYSIFSIPESKVQITKTYSRDLLMKKISESYSIIWICVNSI